MPISFKDELAAKLSAGPMFGGRPPVPGARPMFGSAGSPPISPNSGAGASGDSIRPRSLSADGEGSQDNSPGQPEDPYMQVAMQRISLNRQRKHRMPSRFSSNLSTSDLPPDSSSAAAGGGGLNQITEEDDGEEADDGLRRHNRQNNRYSRNRNNRPSSSDVRTDTSSDSDDSSSEENDFGRISKSLPREDREPASPFSAASSSSPCGQRLSYAERSEEDEEGGDGGGDGDGGTVSRSPLTSSSGDGLFDASEPIITPRTSLRPAGGRPSSMFVGSSLQEELQGIVQARLSRIMTTTSRTGEGDQSVKLRPGPRPNQPQIRCRRSPPRATTTPGQGQGFGVVLRRSAQTSSGATSTLETRRSSNSTSPSSARRAVSIALTGLEDRPVRVHDLIKAFQRDSR
uniref:Uncharacterized protein n=1 Tax=Schistocephalus solidus TaxID=70667 RepID=A0A0X3P4Y4_SCHSO